MLMSKREKFYIKQRIKTDKLKVLNLKWTFVIKQNHGISFKLSEEKKFKSALADTVRRRVNKFLSTLKDGFSALKRLFQEKSLTYYKISTIRPMELTDIWCRIIVLIMLEHGIPAARNCSV